MDAGLDDPNKAVLVLGDPEDLSTDVIITAKPRSDAWTGGDWARAGSRSKSSCYLKEDSQRITLGNSKVEFVFDKLRGGALVGMSDKRRPDLKLQAPGQNILGQWIVEFDGSPSISTTGAAYQKGECTLDREGATLKLFNRQSGANLIQIYALKEDRSYLICRGAYENLDSKAICLNQCRYALTGLAIGGRVDGNKYAYPPQVFHYVHGDLKDATPDFMNKRYIYGCMQQTTKLMLPYAMIHNDRVKKCLTIAGVNGRTVVRVGALGGDSGSLTSLFDVFKVIPSKRTEEMGSVYLALLQGDWKEGALAERELLMAEAGFRAPKTMPPFIKDLVIMADGIPGVNINTFDDLANILQDYRDAGITAVWIGGKVWFCPYSLDPKTGVDGFIPMPRNGYMTPDPAAGDIPGLKRLIAKAHSLGMKLCVWGPASMSGIHIQSEEARTRPDWWVYDKDGNFSKWYPLIAPANPNSPGWRTFFLKNVRRIVKDYGVDGFWLDSSWQDHRLNYKAKDGWYGGPNGAKLSLIEEIVKEAKSLNPNSIVMAEGGGVETLNVVDAAYIQAFGIWPAISADDVQEFVESEELNRIPGMRPFGQICQGLGFYADMSGYPREMAEKYKESWRAKTFLVSTLDRVPVYFGLNWGIGMLLHGHNVKYPEGSENNPERREAERSRKEFKDWFDSFKAINKIRAEHREVREGQTAFDSIKVSAPSIVHYVRQLKDQASLILVNAECKPQTFTLRLTKPKTLGISPGRQYAITDLMTGKNVAQGSGAEIERGVEISLKDYGCAVLKITAL